MGYSQFNSNVDPLARRAAGALKWTRYDADVIPAWIAETDFEPLPEIVDAIRKVADTSLFGYTDDTQRLIDACVGWMKRRHGWEIDPGLVMPLTDVMQGVEAAVTALSEPGDGVVVTTPVYFPFFNVAPSANRRQVEWPLRLTEKGWEFHVDDLDGILRNDPGISVILLSHPHNPTGRVIDSDTMDAIVATAARHNVMIVSDEIHCDLIYPGIEYRSMLTAKGAEDRVVVSTSAAKTFAISGLRASVLVCGSADMRKRIESAHPWMLMGHVSVIGVATTSAAWETGDVWVDGLVAHLANMRLKLIDRLGDEAPEVVFHPPDATFLAWLDLARCQLGDSPAHQLVDQARVAAGEGTLFGTGGDHHVRLNFATSADLLDQIIDRLIPHLGR